MKNKTLFKEIHSYLIIIIGCLGIMGAFGTFTYAKEKEYVMSVEEKNVLNVIKRMTTAFQNSDIEGVMASYEDSAIVVFEPGQPISDPAILRKMFKGAFKLNPEFTYSGHEVFLMNDIAIHIAPWIMNGKTPDGIYIEQSGLSIAVLRRQSDGSWLMVIDDPHGQYLMTN